MPVLCSQEGSLARQKLSDINHSPLARQHRRKLPLYHPRYQRPSEEHRLPPLWGYNRASRLPLHHVETTWGTGLLPLHSNEVLSSLPTQGWCQRRWKWGLPPLPSGKQQSPSQCQWRVCGEGEPGTLPPSSSDKRLTTLGGSGELSRNLDFSLHLAVTKWHPSALPQWYQRILPNIGGFK